MTPIVFAEGNIFGVPAGIALLVNDAYGFLLAPPAPGTYEIEVAFGPDVVVTYQVSVEAAQIIEPEATPEGTPEGATPVT